jgi:DNA (cytosine-5)-methyltransferase 1
MRYFSTFSGIGGFEIGIQNAYLKYAPVGEKPGEKERPQGRERSTDEQSALLRTRNRSAPLCVGYSEIDKYAIKVYEKQFKGVKNYGDITKINADELPDFDCLVGGFPCQAFSIAGKRKGFDDTRGTLFFDLARILRAKQPRLFVFENVKGLLSHDNGHTFATIIATLTELGYDLQWQVLNSKNHGVPQNRERVFIVGHLRGTRRPEVFPIGEDGKSSSKQHNEGIQESEIASTVTATYWKGGKGSQIIQPAQWRRTEKGKQARRESQKRGQDKTPFSDGHREIVPKDSDVIGTITSQAIAKDSLLFDHMKIRRLTPIECERLQGFPDNWTALGIGDEPISDSQRYKQCGNAISVPVVEAVFTRIFNSIVI